MLRVSQLGNAAVLLLFAMPHATALSLSHAARTGVRAEPRCTRNHVHEARALCERCQRPHRVCLCAALPPVPVVTQTRVLILQHPVEAKKTVATVPLVELCLANCTVVRGMRFEPELREIQAAHTAHTSTSPLLRFYSRSHPSSCPPPQASTRPSPTHPGRPRRGLPAVAALPRTRRPTP